MTRSRTFSTSALAAAAWAAAATMAGAADLPSRRAPPPVAFVPPAFTWTGFYAGVNAGGLFGRGGSFTDPVRGSVTSTGSEAGFVGGGQVGYNYQFTPGSGFVVGVEADFQGVAGANRATGLAIAGVPYNSIRPSLDYLGTVRGRVGYAFDKLLVYGTGGLAYGGGSRPANSSSYTYTLPDTTRIGFAAGAGIVYAFTPTITAKIEGLYVHLGRGGGGTLSTYDAATAAYYGPGRKNDDFAIGRVGLNYKF